MLHIIIDYYYVVLVYINICISIVFSLSFIIIYLLFLQHNIIPMRLIYI